MIAVETARRVVADVLATTAASVSISLSGMAAPAAQASASGAAALKEVRNFLSELKEPPETEAERLHMTSLLHALDDASRLVEAVAGDTLSGQAAEPLQDPRAVELCMRAMRAAQTVGSSISSESALSTHVAPIGWSVSPEVAAALVEAEGAARDLDILQRDHRAATLASVAPGKLTATDAFARIEAARRLDRIAHHAWRSSVHLLGGGAHDDLAP